MCNVNKSVSTLSYNHSPSYKVCKVLNPFEFSREIIDLVRVHQLVERSGKFNFQGCKIPFNEKNTCFVRSLLSSKRYY